MHHKKILTTIIGDNQTSCLEVTLSSDSPSGRILELRRLSWGEGVGWYCQQTLRLDPKEAENLFHTLRQNQIQWRGPSNKKGKVIPFPSLPANQAERPLPRLFHVQEKQLESSPSLLSPGEHQGAKQRREKSVTSRAEC